MGQQRTLLACILFSKSVHIMYVGRRLHFVQLYSNQLFQIFLKTSINTHGQNHGNVIRKLYSLHILNHFNDKNLIKFSFITIIMIHHELYGKDTHIYVHIISSYTRNPSKCKLHYIQYHWQTHF